MKRKIFTLMALMGLMAATSATAQIAALPFTADFEESTLPFDGGEVVNATDVGNVLLVNNTTAAAAFAMFDTSEPYTIAPNEEVAVAFTAYHGWEANPTTATVQLLNSDGVVLLGYTYTYKACNVTDVVIGGQTAAGFEPFMGQANFNNNRSANGYDHSQHYVTTENYSPKVTMKLHGQGAVSFNFKYMAAKSVNIDKTFSANLSGVKMDLAKMVITDNCTNKQRAFCLDNLSISSQQKMLYKYVVNYYDENSTLIKTAEGAAEEGAIVAVSQEPLWVDGVKYFVLSDDSEEKPVATDNSTVVSVQCKTAATYHYTVTALMGETLLGTLIKSSYYEGENVVFPYPRYFNVDGTLAKKDATNSVYNGTFLLDEDNKDITVDYALTETSNVICLAEAETLPLLNAVTTGNVANRCSNRAGAYASEDTKMVKLAPGTYTLIAAGYGGNLVFKAGGEEVLNMESQGYWRETASEPFTLAEETELTFIGGSGENAALDYIVLQSEDGAIVSEMTRWDFTQWSEQTVSNLRADAAASKLDGWSDVEKQGDAENDAEPTDISRDNCFWAAKTMVPDANGELSANGELIQELRGLRFQQPALANRNLAIAVNYPSTSLGTYHGPAYLWLGGSKKDYFIIPSVKGGTEIKMGVESHKSSDARGVQLFVNAGTDTAVEHGTQLKDADGNDVAVPKEYTEQAWYVPETADIIVYNTNGCHIYFIEAVQTTGPTTAISTVESEVKAASGIFTLSGLRVEKPGKGLYIVGGKKMVIK